VMVPLLGGGFGAKCDFHFEGHVAALASAAGRSVKLVFRRREDAWYLPPQCQYGADLTTWTTAQDGVQNVSIAETADGFAPGIDRIEVRIPKALAPSGRLFARLWASE